MKTKAYNYGTKKKNEINTVVNRLMKIAALVPKAIRSPYAYENGMKNNCETCNMDKEKYKLIVKSVKVVELIADEVIENEQNKMLDKDEQETNKPNKADSKQEENEFPIQLDELSRTSDDHNFKCVLLKLQKSMGNLLLQLCYCKMKNNLDDERCRKYETSLNTIHHLKFGYTNLTNNMIRLFKILPKEKTSPEVCVACLKEEIADCREILEELLKHSRILKVTMRNEDKCCSREYQHVHALVHDRYVVLRYEHPFEITTQNEADDISKNRESDSKVLPYDQWPDEGDIIETESNKAVLESPKQALIKEPIEDTLTEPPKIEPLVEPPQRETCGQKPNSLPCLCSSVSMKLYPEQENTREDNWTKEIKARNKKCKNNINAVVKRIMKITVLLPTVLQSPFAYKKGKNNCETCNMDKETYKLVMKSIKVVDLIADEVIEKEQWEMLNKNEPEKNKQNGTLFPKEIMKCSIQLNLLCGTIEDHNFKCSLLELQKSIGDLLLQLCYCKVKSNPDDERCRKYDVSLNALEQLKFEYKNLTYNMIRLFKTTTKQKTLPEECVLSVKEEIEDCREIMEEMLKHGRNLKVSMRDVDVRDKCCTRNYHHVHALMQERHVVLKYEQPFEITQPCQADDILTEGEDDSKILPHIQWSEENYITETESTETVYEPQKTELKEDPSIEPLKMQPSVESQKSKPWAKVRERVMGSKSLVKSQKEEPSEEPLQRSSSTEPSKKEPSVASLNRETLKKFSVVDYSVYYSESSRESAVVSPKKELKTMDDDDDIDSFTLPNPEKNNQTTSFKHTEKLIVTQSALVEDQKEKLDSSLNGDEYLDSFHVEESKKVSLPETNEKNAYYTGTKTQVYQVGNTQPHSVFQPEVKKADLERKTSSLNKQQEFRNGFSAAKVFSVGNPDECCKNKPPDNNFKCITDVPLSASIDSIPLEKDDVIYIAKWFKIIASSEEFIMIHDYNDELKSRIQMSLREDKSNNPK